MGRDTRRRRRHPLGYPCPEAKGLADWQMVPLAMKRTVQSRDGDTLDAAPEVVWLNPNVPDAIPTLFGAAA